MVLSADARRPDRRRESRHRRRHAAASPRRGSIGLLSALNLPTPKALADGKAGKAKEAQGALAEFIGDVKGLVAAGHPQAGKMRTLAAAAGADAKAGLWDQVKEKVAQGRKHPSKD